MARKTMVVTVPVKVEVDLAEYGREYGDYPASTKEDRDAIRQEVQYNVIEAVAFDFERLSNIYKVRA